MGGRVFYNFEDSRPFHLSIPMTRRRLILLCLALAAATWMVVRQRGTTTSAKPALRSAAGRGSGWNFRNGKWQRVDPRQLAKMLQQMRLRAPGMVSVSGTVVHRSTKLGLPGAEVVFASPAGEATTVTDHKGRYTLNIRSGFYRAFARLDGYITVGRAMPVRVPGPPDVAQIGAPRDGLAPLIGLFRDRTGVDMQLQGGGRIVGTVYDEAGRPITGAIVSGKLVSGWGDSRSVLGTDVDETDLDGTFSIDVPSGTIQLTAVHEDFAGLDGSSRARVYVTQGDTERRELTMTAGCIITGRVVDHAGKPSRAGQLEARGGGPPPNDFLPVSKIGASGSFRFSTTDERTVALRAWPYKSPPSAVREFDCEDGARHADVLFVLPDADAELDGVLLDEGGEPVVDAYVDIVPLTSSGMAQQERSDVYGEWGFYSLPAGDYRMSAYVPGKGATAAIVRVPGDHIRLQLSGTGSIAGTVKTIQEGSFRMYIERCAVDRDGRRIQLDELTMAATTVIVPVESGEFRVDGLPACHLGGRASIGGRAMRFSVQIKANQVVPLSL